MSGTQIPLSVFAQRARRSCALTQVLFRVVGVSP